MAETVRVNGGGMMVGRIRHKLLVMVAVLSLAGSASAYAPWLIMGISWFVQYVGIPVTYALSCGLSYSPALRMFGTEQNVYGIDWGSMACHAENVYGMQLALCGGVVERRMCGLQLGILASGFASEKLPFGDYHYFNSDYSRLYGIQVGTFATKTATANGMQIGLVNIATKLRGLQVGLYNTADSGCGLQIGLINCTESGLAGFLPVLNLVY